MITPAGNQGKYSPDKYKINILQSSCFYGNIGTMIFGLRYPEVNIRVYIMKRSDWSGFI